MHTLKIFFIVCKGKCSSFFSKYHPGVWTKSLDKYTCCDQIDRKAPGCELSFTERHGKLLHAKNRYHLFWFLIFKVLTFIFNFFNLNSSQNKFESSLLVIENVNMILNQIWEKYWKIIYQICIKCKHFIYMKQSKSSRK